VDGAGADPIPMHQRMAAVLDEVIDKIHSNDEHHPPVRADSYQARDHGDVSRRIS
jgi:hypothetical protein